MEEKAQLRETLIEGGKEVSDYQSIRTASISSSIYNLINGILGSGNFCALFSGSGILVLPMSVSKFGWFLGVVFLVLFACKTNCNVDNLVLSAITCYLLSEIYYFTGSTTYAGMGRELFGKPAEYIINCIQVLYGLGALFSYTIVAADESHYVMEKFLGSVDSSSWMYWFVDRSSLLSIITLLFIIPPALLPRMDHLRFTSFISIGAIAYLLFAVSAFLFHFKLAHHPSPHNWSVRSGRSSHVRLLHTPAVRDSERSIAH